MTATRALNPYCILWLIAVQLWCIPADAPADDTGFIRSTFVDQSGAHGYYVYVPENYDPRREWPVMLFLHGAGERGRDPDKVISIGMGPVIENWDGPFPFIVVFPQCEDLEGRVTRGWVAGSPDAERALAILAHVEQTYRTDPERRVLVGWSMGGFGTWSLAAADPDRWSAAVPMSGGGDPSSVVNLSGLPVWAVHGTDDAIVRPGASRQMVDAAREAGIAINYTEINGCGHDVWLRLVDNQNFVAWLLDPDQVDPADVRWPENDPEIDLHLPFRTAIVAPRAVSIRAGNDALRLMAYGAPQAIDADLLTGTLEDVEQTFEALDEEFEARLIGLSFRAEIAAAYLQGVGVDRLRARIGLEPLKMSISRIEVEGGDITASAGLTEVSIGHTYPAWLNIDLRPRIENGVLKFEALSSSFEFTQDNWYITPPEVINITGAEISQRDAKSALVGGLYREQERIRQEVLAAVPDLLASLEESIDEALREDYLVSVWPLPVYQPRVRLGFDSVWVDAAGMSAVFNVEVAATDWEQAPSVPVQWHPLGVRAPEVARPAGLEIRVAAGVMEALSEGVRETGVSRIHVLDIGNQEFAALTDAAQMEDSVPGIAAAANGSPLASRIELTQPFRIDVAATTQASQQAGADAPLPLILYAPRVRVPIGVEGTADEIAEFDVSFSQRMDLELEEQAFRPPLLHVYWSPDVVVDATGRRLDGGASAATANGVPAEYAVNAEAFAQQFAESWSSWMTSEPSPPAEVYDLEVGQTGLRCQAIAWDHQSLVVRYGAPLTRLTNISNSALIVRTRGPNDPAWGERQTIAAGASILIASEPPLWVVAINETGSEPVLLSVGADHQLKLVGRELQASLPETP